MRPFGGGIAMDILVTIAKFLLLISWPESKADCALTIQEHLSKVLQACVYGWHKTINFLVKVIPG